MMVTYSQLYGYYNAYIITRYITPIANRISYPVITALCQGFTVGKIDSVNQLVTIGKAITI